MKNYRLRMVGSILEKFEGFSKKFWIKTEILLNSGGLQVYLNKTEGALLQNAPWLTGIGLVDLDWT